MSVLIARNRTSARSSSQAELDEHNEFFLMKIIKNQYINFIQNLIHKFWNSLLSKIVICDNNHMTILTSVCWRIDRSGHRGPGYSKGTHGSTGGMSAAVIAAPHPRRQFRAGRAGIPASRSAGPRTRPADRLPAPGIGKQAAQHIPDALAFAVLGQHVLHPVERLNDPHGRPSGPIEAAGRGEPEMNFLAAEPDRLQPRIDQNLDARRHGGGESEFVGGGHAVDDGARLIAAGDGTDDGAVVGYGLATGQIVLARPIVEASIDASQLAGVGKALQSLVDGGAGAEVGKIACKAIFRRSFTSPTTARPLTFSRPKPAPST